MATVRFRPAIVVACSLLAWPAWAGKADVVTRLLADGKCDDAVARVDQWEERNALGAEDYDLRRLRAQAGLCVAKASDSLAAYEAFLTRFNDWPEAKDARTRLYDLAFQAAQLEGTARAMKAFVARYPDAPHVEQARRQEEAWSFEDAAKSGDPKQVQRWLEEHPDSTLREQAWEAMVQAQEGIYLLTAGGQPFRIEPVPVADDGGVAVPSGLPVAGEVPTIGVNLPGAGRGETSEWWSLVALEQGSDGTIRVAPTSPVAKSLGQVLGVEPPGAEAGLLDLVRAPGAHLARVATTRNPLLLSEGCDDFARFALVLRSPGAPSAAFPFAVDCPAGRAPTSPVGLLLDVVSAAEDGHRDRARTAWAKLEAMPEAVPLRRWLTAALERPEQRLVDDRPGVGDWMVWLATAEGTTAYWLRVDGESVRQLGVRGGWALPARGSTVTSTSEAACAANVLGSVAGTVFCSDGAPRAPALDGVSLGWGMPPAAALAAAGIRTPPELEDAVAIWPRWDGELTAAWSIKVGRRTVEVRGPAPEAWTKAAPVPPALDAWLDAQPGILALGLAPITSAAWSTYTAFTGR